MAPIPATPYPDKRYRTRMMWWDRRTFVNHAEPEQVSKILMEITALAIVGNNPTVSAHEGGRAVSRISMLAALWRKDSRRQRCRRQSHLRGIASGLGR